MQDRSSLRTSDCPVPDSNATEETPLLTPRPPRRKRKCLSIFLGILIAIITFCTLFFAICSPFQFISFFNGWSNRIFQTSYWAQEGRAGWWYRLFVHETHSRDCKIRKADRYDNFNSTAWWNSGHAQPQDWSLHEMELRTIPEYVLEYAPLIHLYSDEEFWPGDIAEHLVHTTPYINYTPIAGCDADYNLTNLNQLNRYGWDTFLQSNDNVEDRPKWLGGEKNIPVQRDGSISTMNDEEKGNDPAENTDFRTYVDEAVRASYDHSSVRSQGGAGPTKRKRRRTLTESQEPGRGGRSEAPAFLIVIPKEDGIVDAFWFFFYSYNLGNTVLNIRFGDHVGDWEHTLVRFKDGQPDSLFFSEHFFGEAYSYQAVEKIGKRPVGYSGTGTHAMYGTPGVHKYILPLGLLHDTTDRGPLWDPRQNMHAYTYDAARDYLRSSTLNPFSPTEWFYFIGHWGDKAYPLSDSRQYRFAGEYHYTNGPLGPRFKNLRRKKVCQQTRQECVLKYWRPGAREDFPSVGHDAGRGWGEGDGEEASAEDREAFLDDTGLEKSEGARMALGL